jgi:hypothetical protein
MEKVYTLCDTYIQSGGTHTLVGSICFNRSMHMRVTQDNFLLFMSQEVSSQTLLYRVVESTHLWDSYVLTEVLHMR